MSKVVFCLTMIYPISFPSSHGVSQLTWPVAIDQTALLQLLSSHATQEFRYYGGTKQVDFIDADGEPLTVEEDKIRPVSEHY